MNIKAAGVSLCVAQLLLAGCVAPVQKPADTGPMGDGKFLVVFIGGKPVWQVEYATPADCRLRLVNMRGLSNSTLTGENTQCGVVSLESVLPASALIRERSLNETLPMRFVTAEACRGWLDLFAQSGKEFDKIKECS